MNLLTTLCMAYILSIQEIPDKPNECIYSIKIRVNENRWEYEKLRVNCSWLSVSDSFYIECPLND